MLELAQFSDRLFFAAVAVYVLAMALQAGEYATTRSGRSRVAVGATVGADAPGGPPASVDEPVTGPAGPGQGDAAAGPGRSRAERYGRMAVALGMLGVVLHLGSMVTRGIAAGRWPLGNMYEYIAAVCLAAVVSWLVLVLRVATTGRSGAGPRAVGIFVLLPVMIMMFLAGTALYTAAAPVMPALQSYWLVIHVTTITASSGLLLVPGVASLLFLVRRSERLRGLAERLPSADVLDRLAYRTTIIAFPLFTFAVITGAIWAEASWGRFWGWDPKETVAFVSWVVYSAYLHARATAGWRTGRAAWINVAGFATMIFNLFFVNLVISGLHSYAGV